MCASASPSRDMMLVACVLLVARMRGRRWRRGFNFILFRINQSISQSVSQSKEKIKERKERKNCLMRILERR